MSGRLCVGCDRSFATDCAVCHPGPETPSSGARPSIEVHLTRGRYVECRRREEDLAAYLDRCDRARVARKATIDAVLDAVLLHLRTFGKGPLPGESAS